MKNENPLLVLCGVILFALNAYSSDLSDLADATKIDRYGTQKPGTNSSFSGSDQNDGINSVDPEQYYIGEGDVFLISIIGNSSIQYVATINQDCYFYIPALGRKKLGKLSLAQAEKQIIDFLQTKFKKSENIQVELAKLKRVTMSINGAVANPGTYTFPGSSRILDALRVANNGSLPSLNECNLREVKYGGRDSSVTIDLFTYLLKNDISGNPYLYPGNNISVSFARRHVSVNAQLRSVVNGWIPIKENEHLSDFLSFLTFDASADTSKIYLQSTLLNDHGSSVTVPWNDASSIVLHDRDVITIPQKKNYLSTAAAAILGEVAQPGLYPIIRDSTTVKDLLEMGGGPTQYADMSRAAIIRHSKTEISDSARMLMLTKSQTPVTRPETNAALSRMSILGDYSIIDLTKSTYSTKLGANDVVVVPRKDTFVYVSGDVKRPGAYEYNKGKPYGYYISLAGGFTKKADRTNAVGIRNYNGISQITDLSEIRAADIIVVPDSQQAKFLTLVLLPILQTVATILSVILAVYSIEHSRS